MNISPDPHSAPPRPEYPRPGFLRREWLNLNGVWSFRTDPGASAAEQNFFESDPDWHDILVPFCPESRLSGIGQTDFMPHVLYRHSFQIPTAWRGRRVLLHFGAVDCDCRVRIDGRECGHHSGGQTPFACDITDALDPVRGEHVLLLQVADLLRSGLHGGGKQAHSLRSEGCFYTRVTGIWQTVWLEPVHPCALADCRVVPDYDAAALLIEPEFFAVDPDARLTVAVFADGGEIARATTVCTHAASLRIALGDRHDWTPEDPFLYDLRFSLTDGAGREIDSVSSYAGLRKIEWNRGRLFLNNREIFLRFVLDQGYYPDGIWTAPTDEAIKNDILLGKSAGFNGARLHQKVFDPRYHYWADRLGYLTWAEFGSWGLDSRNPEARANFLREWAEAVLRDRNHPSIIGWVPLNESCFCSSEALAARFPDDQSLAEYRQWVEDIYRLTRRLDPTRPINDSSGYVHVMTDLWSVHAYRKNAEELATGLFPDDAPVMRHAPKYEPDYAGQPYLNDEFGGFLYIPADAADGAPSWGYYGCRIESPEELCRRIGEQTRVMLDCEKMAGYCYTQLTDVEQERNGIYNYDRSAKAPPAMLQAVFGEKPPRSQW